MSAALATAMVAGPGSAGRRRPGLGERERPGCSGVTAQQGDRDPRGRAAAPGRQPGRPRRPHSACPGDRRGRHLRSSDRRRRAAVSSTRRSSRSTGSSGRTPGRRCSPIAETRRSEAQRPPAGQGSGRAEAAGGGEAGWRPGRRLGRRPRAGAARGGPGGDLRLRPGWASSRAPGPPVPGCGSSTISNPVQGTVTSNSGRRGGRNHDGVDMGAPTGTAVRAAACGSVSLAGQQSGYGNMVCVTSTSQFSTCYAHLSSFGDSNGAAVRQGQVIGYVGCTGSCTGPHLHFETRVNGQAQDPRTYLSARTMPGSAAASRRAGAEEGRLEGGASPAVRRRPLHGRPGGAAALDRRAGHERHERTRTPPPTRR